MTTLQAVHARRRLLLVIGNGFSMGVLRSLGLSERIRVACEDLIPGDPSLKFLPINPHPSTLAGDFWRPDLWPRLHKMSDDGMGFWDISNHIAKKPLQTLREGNRVYFGDDNDITTEFRFYLYYLFTQYSMVFRDECRFVSLAKECGWAGVLDKLVSSFQTTVVNYNYDIIFDDVLNSLGYFVFGNLVPNRYMEFSRQNIPSNRHVRVIRPHGSVWASFGRAIPAWAPYAPWLRPAHINVSHNTVAGATWELNFPPQFAPAVPDILPPGSDIKKMGIGDHDALAACKQAAAASDIVVFVGFNGGSCDYGETLEIASSVPGEAVVYSVMKVDDWEESGVNRAFRDVRGAKSVSFVPPSQTRELVDWF
jgi:hypothetical protein